MSKCKKCSAEIDEGKYCRRCKLERQSRRVEIIEELKGTLITLGAIIVVILSNWKRNRND